MPNLFATSRSNPTENYYSSLTQPSAVSSTLGNNVNPFNRSATSNPTAIGTNYFDGGGWQQGQSATPYLQQYLNGRSPYGSTGFNIENSMASRNNGVDPRLYNYGYTTFGGASDNPSYTLEHPDLDPRGLISRNGSNYAQVGQSLDRIIDPTKVFYDDKYGLLTDPSNISMPEGNLEKYMPAIVTAALGAPTLAHAGLIPGMPGGGTEVAVPGNMAPLAPTTVGELGGTAGAGVSGTGLGTYGGMSTGLDGGSVITPASSGVSATAGVGGGSTAGTAATSIFNNPLFRAAGGLAGGLASAYFGNQAQQNANAAANRADPFGPANREIAIQKMWDLYNDPSSIQNTPGYKFRQEQGEQGINRGAAKSGYLRSPNVLYDLAKFNSGLAEQAYNTEMTNLMRMAGVDINPSTAAQLQYNGNQASTNMRAGGIAQIIAGGGNFWDWLNGVGA